MNGTCRAARLAVRQNLSRTSRSPALAAENAGEGREVEMSWRAPWQPPRPQHVGTAPGRVQGRVSARARDAPPAPEQPRCRRVGALPAATPPRRCRARRRRIARRHQHEAADPERQRGEIAARRQIVRDVDRAGVAAAAPASHAARICADRRRRRCAGRCARSPPAARRDRARGRPAQTACGFFEPNAPTPESVSEKAGRRTRSSALAISSATWPSTSPMKRRVR